MHSKFLGKKNGYTVIEIMVVIAIMSLMMGLISMSMHGISAEGSIRQGASTMSQLLDQARSYSIANNSYTFVGITEVNGLNDPGQVPQSAGNGRVAAMVLATLDNSSGLNANFVTTNVAYVSQLEIMQGVHLTTSLTYQGKPTVTTDNLMPTQTPSFTAGYNMAWPRTGTAKYTFKSVIQFSPSGVAQLLGPNYQSSRCVPIEIDLQPAFGSTVNANTQSTVESAIILVDGASGIATLYRP